METDVIRRRHRRTLKGWRRYRGQKIQSTNEWQLSLASWLERWELTTCKIRCQGCKRVTEPGNVLENATQWILPRVLLFIWLVWKNGNGVNVNATFLQSKRFRLDGGNSVVNYSFPKIWTKVNQTKSKAILPIGNHVNTYNPFQAPNYSTNKFIFYLKRTTINTTFYLALWWRFNCTISLSEPKF